MGNIFPRWTNSLPWKFAIFFVLVAGLLALAVAYYFTPKYTRVGYRPIQPVTFSHDLHVKQLGLDCRYCHSFVEVAAHADIPTTQTCMTCHTQVQKDSSALAPLRDSWQMGAAIPWVRVDQLPDYVYFNHAAHVNRGVGCADCHGSVNEMNVVFQQQPQSMSWCLNCHRHPEDYLRLPNDVFKMCPATRSDTQRKTGSLLKAKWNVAPPLSCEGCHR